MTRFNSRFSRRLLLAGAPAAVTMLGAPAWAQGKEDINVGAIASFTGPAAAFSREYAEGFQVYIKAWNQRGGHDGRKIAIEILDDETNPVNAVNAFRRLAANPKVSIVWAALASQTALGIKAIASEFKVPVISGGGIDLLGKPADPYFFKVTQGVSDLLAGLFASLKAKGIKTMATLNPNDAVGQTDARTVKEMAAAAGITVVAAETFAQTDSSFTGQLVRIRNAKPQFLYNGATGNPAILVFKQYKQLGMNIDMAVSFAAISGAFFAGIGGPKEATGILSVVTLGALGDGAPGAAAALYKDASAALGKPAQLFHTIGWDTGILTEHVFKVSDGTREGLRAALDKVKDLPAINGPFTFVPDNHIGQDTRGLALARFTGEKWVVAG